MLKPDGQEGPAHVAVTGLSVSMCAASHFDGAADEFVFHAGRI